MTTGIYTLTFKGLEDWKYVGQSYNIEGRFVGHKSALRMRKSNFLLLEAYEISGEYPKLDIIEVCSSSILNDREVYWIHKLNTIKLGLNLTDRVNNHGYGEYNFNSKYPNSLIEEVFHIICNNLHISNKEIALLGGVPTHLVSQIMNGNQHIWLKEIYPEKYDLLINRTIKRTKSAKKLGIEYPKIKSPEGQIYSVENLQEFARVHKINNSSLCQLLHGKRKSANKWKLA